MSTTMQRAQIATQIHFLLLRELGQGIDIEQMLKHPRYARDVLLVCDACKESELAKLAAQYRRSPDGAKNAAASPKPEAPTTGGRTAHPTEWSHNTSGFGVSQPMDQITTTANAAAIGTDAPKRRIKPSLGQRLVSRWFAHR